MKWLLAVVSLAGCIEISPADGTVRCSPSGKACPDGYRCASDDFCRRGAPAPDLAVDNDMGQAGDDLTPASGADLTPPPPDLTPACVGITVSTLSGTGVAGLMNGAGTVAQFDGAMGITADSAGTLYVTDNNNHLLRKVLPDGTTSSFSGPTGFLSAWRVAQNFGTFYMVDQVNDNLQVIQPSGSASLLFSIGAIISVAISPTNGIFFTTTCGGVFKYTGTVQSYSGPGEAAQMCAFADGAASAGRYSNPRDLVFDSAGILYVADSGNFRIRKVATDGSVTTLAGSTKGHTDAQGASAQFDEASGLTIDPQTHLLYVADNTTIRVVTPSGAVSTLVGTTSGFANGNGCVARFGKLDGITYFAGALYAVDINRIRKIQLP